MLATTSRAKLFGGLLAATVLGGVPQAASAHPREIGIEIGDRGDRVWVEPVFQTVDTRQWVEPVYQTVVEKVWVPESTTTRVQQVFVPEVVQSRDVVIYDRWNRPYYQRQQVIVAPAHYEDQATPVYVPGHFEERTTRQLVANGHWDAVPVRQVVVPGHWEARPHHHGFEIGVRLPF